MSGPRTTDGGPPTSGATLREHFPGYRFLSPNPIRVVRAPGRPERYCVYGSTIGSIPVHFHTMAEVTLVLDGFGTARIAGRRYEIGPGVLTLAPSNVLHGHTCDEPVTKLVCMFDMAMVEPLLAWDQITGHLNAVGTRYPAAVQLPADQAAAIRDRFDTILTEGGRTAQLGSGVLAATTIIQVLVEFLRRATSTDDTAAIEDLGVPDDDLTRVLGHLQQHFTEPINRASVARALGMRPEAVSRAFQQSAGDTFSGFLQHLRIGHAVELLQSSRLSAAEIARLSGFESYRTFARAFTSAYGVAPGSFRAAVRDDPTLGLDPFHQLEQ